MKRIRFALVTLILSLLLVGMGCEWAWAAAKKNYGRSCVDNSCATGYDLSDLTGMIDGDTAYIPADPTYGGPLSYEWDEDSGLSESLPDIKDADIAGDGRWILQVKPVQAGGTGSGTAGGARTNLDAQQQDTTLDELAALSMVKGDIYYFNGTNFVKLAIGNDGEILEVDTDVPKWTNSLSLSYITLPNAANPLPTTEARIHWDSDDNMLVMGDAGTNTRVIATDVKCWEPACFYEPNVLAGSSEPAAGEFLIKTFLSEQFPGGATITAILVETSATCDDTIIIEEKYDSAGTWTVSGAGPTVDSIVLSGITTKETSITAPAITADYSVFVDMSALVDDIDWMCVTLCGRINTYD